MKPTKVVNPGPSALVFVNGRKGAKKHMPKARRKTKTRAASKRRPSTTAAKRATPKARKRNPTTAAKRTGKRRATKRRSFRNPAADFGSLLQLGGGAVLSQVGAGLIPYGGSQPWMLALKAIGVGYGLEYLGKAFSPLRPLTAQAAKGGKLAAVLTGLNAYVMPTVLRWVNGVVAPAKSNGGGAGVNGFMVIPGSGGRSFPPAQPVAANGSRGVNGVMVVPRSSYS
jgi:hypothetical protein